MEVSVGEAAGGAGVGAGVAGAGGAGAVAAASRDSGAGLHPPRVITMKLKPKSEPQERPDVCRTRERHLEIGLGRIESRNIRRAPVVVRSG